MSTLTLICGMAAIKYRDLTAVHRKPVRTPTPLGLHQGTTIEFRTLEFRMLQGQGTILPVPDQLQHVSSVGHFNQWGFEIRRSYLSDGKSFIETVADQQDATKASSVRLYTMHMERDFTTPDERDFFISREDGYIGDSAATVPVNPAVEGSDTVTYPRLWSPGEGRVDYVTEVETVTTADGANTAYTHRMMQYARLIGTDTEYLITDAVKVGDYEGLNLWIGIDLTSQTYTAYPAA